LQVTKQEFVDAVASRANLSRRDAGAAVDAVLDTVTDALKKRDTITFTGFGKFSTSEPRARASIPAIRARKCRSLRRPCRSSRQAAS
jgi:DNA-binding protein HU-beta